MLGETVKIPPDRVRIAPSLLSADFAHLSEQVGAVEAAGADWLHVDVMDGHFVPNLTIGPFIVEAIKRVASIPLDVHLMIENPIQTVPDYVSAGADSVTFHLEAVEDVVHAARFVRSLGCRAGVAVNPDTPIQPILQALDDLDLVLIMSVFPGFGGQRFLPHVVDKASAIRCDAQWTGDLEIDGGIDLETLPVAAARGINAFVAGTAIFKSGDIPSRIKEMRRLGRERLETTCL